MSNIPALISNLEAEAEVEAEQGHRPVRVILPIVLRADSKQLRKSRLLAEGTITTLIGRRGTRYIADLEECLRRGDAEALDLAAEMILDRAEASMRSMLALYNVRQASTIVDVSHGTSWLAKHVILGESAEIAISRAIWSGGAIPEKNFTVRAWPRVGSRSSDVDIAIVLAEPRLSELERAVLQAVPAELSDVHIKGPSVAWMTVLTIGGVKRGDADHELKQYQEAQMDGRQRVQPERGERVRSLGENTYLSRVSLLGSLRQWFFGPVSVLREKHEADCANQVQDQQADTKQQQQQQQAADTKQQQQNQQDQHNNKQQEQRQQQQQRDANQQEQRQQQQQQQADTKEQVQQQQEQQQNFFDQQQQQQQQAEHDGKQVNQQNQEQEQQQQQRNTAQQQDRMQQDVQHQADGQQQVHQDHEHAQQDVFTKQNVNHEHSRVQHQAATVQDRGLSRSLSDLMLQGMAVRPFDEGKYVTLLEAIDFGSLDATQSVRQLLQLREQLVTKGMA